MRLFIVGTSLALAAALAAGAGPQIQIEYIAAEFGGAVVKGAPYSAQPVTETSQTLPDGNRIVRKSTAWVWRDSQGRTRREQTVGSIGMLAVQEAEPLRLITISDPVAGVSYSLNTRTQTATRMAFEPSVAHAGLPGGALWVQREAAEDVFEVALPPAQAGARVIEKTVIRHSGDQQGKAEKLGQQVMEGILVEGTRETAIIPAGQIGNERPIETVAERWYSPRLQTVVMSRRSDPRMGETVYRLTNISLGEPAASLFRVPAGYAITDRPQADNLMILRK